MSTFSRTQQAIASRFDAARAAFDIRDVLLFGGLAMLGYGLYRYRPWVAFTVCGALLMLIGFSMRGPR